MLLDDPVEKEKETIKDGGPSGHPRCKSVNREGGLFLKLNIAT
jgi:hypothetical protein